MSTRAALSCSGSSLIRSGSWRFPPRPGTIAAAAARPDGEVWYQWSDAGDVA